MLIPVVGTLQECAQEVSIILCGITIKKNMSIDGQLQSIESKIF